MATCSTHPTILRSISIRSAARFWPSEPREVRAFPTRRQTLFLASSALLLRPNRSLAQEIPLFGLRKKLKKAEEEVEVIMKEGFEAVEAVEKGVEAVERGVVAVEEEVEEAVSFGGLAQAGTVAAAEVFGVVIATAIVNGIIGPQGQRS